MYPSEFQRPCVFRWKTYVCLRKMLPFELDALGSPPVRGVARSRMFFSPSCINCSDSPNLVLHSILNINAPDVSSQLVLKCDGSIADEDFGWGEEW